MLHKLVDDGKALWSNDPDKRSIIYEKYKQYQVSVSISVFLFTSPFIFNSNIQKEEIDWIWFITR